MKLVKRLLVAGLATGVLLVGAEVVARIAIAKSARFATLGVSLDNSLACTKTTCSMMRQEW